MNLFINVHFLFTAPTRVLSYACSGWWVFVKFLEPIISFACFQRFFNKQSSLQHYGRFSTC